MEFKIEETISSIANRIPRKLLGGLGFGGIIYYAALNLPAETLFQVIVKVTGIICITGIAWWTIWTHWQLEKQNPTPEKPEEIK
jgi:hypothetical protein